MARIYVVNRRIPGEVRGDWAVRKENGPILSEGHKTKEKAVREARKAATPRDTVIVQGVDGQFQRSFSPRNGRDEGQRGRRRRGREEVRRRKRLGVKKDSNVTKLLKGKRRLL